MCRGVFVFGVSVIIHTMKQVVWIHGGTAFNSYDDYIEDLKVKPVYRDRLTFSPMWYQKLDSALGGSVEVLLPTMPGKQNASFEEWSIWFERLQEVFEDDVVLVGHSLGAIFLAKYFASNNLPKKAKAVLLLAGPHSDESTEDLGGFKITTKDSLDNIYKSAKRVVFVHALDDPVVNIYEQDRFKESLPMAEYRTMPGPDHFMRADFPEMVQLIKGLLDE